MFHTTVIDRRLKNLADTIRRDIDRVFEFKEYSIEEVQEWIEHLDKAWDPVKQQQIRPLSVEEEAFIRHEVNHCKASWIYWATRYAMLKDKNMSLIRFKPTPVQDVVLDIFAKAELDVIQGKTGDGLIFAVMKARQVGISTLSELIIAHRVFFYAHTTALIAADEDGRSQNLYEMLVRVYDNLPWWMQPRSMDPTKDYRVKNKQLYYHDQDSVIRVGSASNMQGGDSGGDKGSLGTGMTLPLCHLSELALWPNPEQIDDALMPSIPRGPRTFAIFESTAKGRHNWWHKVWTKAKEGIGRRRPIFIPWYLEPTYKLPAPVDWTPNEITIAHAKRVKLGSPVWCGGKAIDLTRQQMYWYERERADYASRKLLYKFLAEYTADDLEAFQNTRSSVFGDELLDDLRQKASNLPIFVDIKPRMQQS